MHIHVLNNSDLLHYLQIVSSIWKLHLMMALELRKWTHDHVDEIADSLYVFYVKVAIKTIHLEKRPCTSRAWLGEVDWFMYREKCAYEDYCSWL